MKLSGVFAILVSLYFCVTANAASFEVRAMPSSIVQYGDSTTAVFIVLNQSKTIFTTRLSITCPNGSVSPSSVSINLKPDAWQIVPVQVSLSNSADQGVVTCGTKQTYAQAVVSRGLDLSSLKWKRKITPLKEQLDITLAAPDTDDSSWDPLSVPSLIPENAYSWCRVHFTAPERWRGRVVKLEIGAVDDNDVTFLNGDEIGRTTGWDVPRSYPLPERLIRWGQDNVICVRVENPTFGGGIYKQPIMLRVGSTKSSVISAIQKTLYKRPAPGRVGSPLPLRRFWVENGVLRYPDGLEVALWGVNYYPQSWYQFENMTKLKVDMKATIRADLDDLQKMSVEIIRIHCFDREISDGDGNIVDNEHLNMLDYLVSECSRRGIYMYFTPIAWWGGPNERKGAFSGETSKPGMTFVPHSREASANYLRHFLTRENRYTNREYRNEPCINLLEVQNEPAYFTYGDISGNAYETQGERPEVIQRDHETFRHMWRTWLSDHKLTESPVFFPVFRYDIMRGYIHQMVSAIRSTGAKQPVAISYFGANDDDITLSIVDSECDAITVSHYPGGWGQMNDGTNLLPQVPPLKLDKRLVKKARLAYEFDTPATNSSCYLYPGIAAYFRSADVQVACQFQYDSISTARWNTDWDAHWLNWHYTPTKAVSYMIGGEAFRRLPRGISYSAPGTELAVGPMATSYTHNLSMLMTPELAMYARSLEDWKPLALPTSPARIVGTGSSPWVSYEGNGAYTIKTTAPGVMHLILNEDSRILGDCLKGSFSSPVAELLDTRHSFLLKLPGWEKARCIRVDTKQAMPLDSNGWILTPGEYEIQR